VIDRSDSDPGVPLRDRILVVDDSSQNRLVACGHLEHAGYDVVEAGSGEEALTLLETTPVDLVVLDILMPGIGGIETCRRIRTTSEIPVLFLTALGARETTEPALAAGADDLLAKPFNRAELLLRVRALIRHHRTAAEIRDAARVLAAQNEQLRRMEHDKRKITELIVHDLKGPIGAILGNVEMMRDYPLPEEVVEAVDDTMVSVQHLDRTVRDMLDLSRSADAALATNREPFDLATVANEVATSLRGYGRWTNVKIVVAIEVPELVADRELIRRVLQNLVHNAIKHSPRNTTVMIAASMDGSSTIIRVTDEGHGVAADEAIRIFDRGMSLDGSHGLGLAFCQLAAAAHGGKIWVEKREPRGAAFVVRIPTCEEASARSANVVRDDTEMTKNQ
jgi:signal transduction histidine kinase